VETEAKLEDLQAVSQHVLASTARINALEAKKRTLEPNSTRFRELSDEIEVLAEEMRQISHAETALAEDLRDEPDLPTVDEADAAKG
jgi:hypothetical protein